MQWWGVGAPDDIATTSKLKVVDMVGAQQDGYDASGAGLFQIKIGPIETRKNIFYTKQLCLFELIFLTIANEYTLFSQMA
jgi:hypothetical protein